MKTGKAIAQIPDSTQMTGFIDNFISESRIKHHVERSSFILLAAI